MATSRSVELVGRVLSGRYRLTRSIGVGASAHVYAAEDVQLRRRVAVKVLHPGLAGDEAFGRRFRAEARAVAGLRHPNILAVHDTGDDDGVPYLVMDLLEGGSLRSLLDRGQLLTPAQAAQVGADVARALAYAHRQGVVHRDIKPANLIFDGEGRITVADFGLARALAAATWTEPIGGILGTARYAAPEQVRDQPLDGRADVYALALVVVEAVTGTVPFLSDNAVGSLMARVDQPIPAGPELGPLAPVVSAAGTVAPSERIEAAGMVVALEAAARNLPVPGPLPLLGAFERQGVERDDAPTEVPGTRLVPFDIEALEPRPPAMPPYPGVTGQPSAPSGRAAGPVPSVPLPRVPSPPIADLPHSTGAGGTGSSRLPDGRIQDRQPSEPVPAQPVPAEPGRRRRGRRLLLALLALLLVAGGAAGAVVATRPAPSHPVPSVVALDQAGAAARLAPLHLRLAVAGRAYSPTVAAGAVIAQDPATGTLREGRAVSVTVSLGPQPVPVPTDLAGTPLSDATRVLTTLGLRVGAVTPAYSLAVPDGDVISSTPASGTLLPGQPVALTVSQGKPIVAVPALTGSYAAAAAALTAAALPSSETDTFSDTVPKGQVIGAAPPPGTQVRVGTPVTVTVSKGPDVVTVPGVSGQSVAAATQALTAAGLTVTGVSGNPTAATTGTSPAAASVVRRGTHVTIVTS